MNCWRELVLLAPTCDLQGPLEIKEFLNFTFHFKIILNLTEVLRVV